jgi:hypothetical protein
MPLRVADRRRAPGGTLIVRAKQRLGRIAAVLLDPMSEDSLAIWNFFDDQIRKVDGADDRATLAFPVVRVTRPAAWSTRPWPPTDDCINERLYPRVPENTGDQLSISILCPNAGERIPGSFGTVRAWRNREIEYEVGPKRLGNLDAVRTTLEALATEHGATWPVVLRPGRHVDDMDVITVANAAHESGFEKIYLDVSTRE